MAELPPVKGPMKAMRTFSLALAAKDSAASSAAAANLMADLPGFSPEAIRKLRCSDNAGSGVGAARSQTARQGQIRSRAGRLDRREPGTGRRPEILLRAPGHCRRLRGPRPRRAVPDVEMSEVRFGSRTFQFGIAHHASSHSEANENWWP